MSQTNVTVLLSTYNGGRFLAEQLDSRNRPCNFVELMPRLREK